MERLNRFFKRIFSNITRVIVGAALYLFAAFSVAQTANFPRDLTLTWTNASEYEGGAPIEAGDLTEVRFECANNAQPTVLIVDATVAAAGEGVQQSEVFVGVIPSAGRYTCYGWSRVSDGTESAPSNAALKKFLGIPMPPLTVTIT